MKRLLTLSALSLLISFSVSSQNLANLIYEDGVSEYQSYAIASGLADEIKSIFGIWLTESHFIYQGSECITDCRQDLKFNIGLLSSSFDLNEDGTEEVFITLRHSITCGSSGCDTYILEENSDGWKIIYKGKEIRTILNEKSNGYYSMLDDMGRDIVRLCKFNKINYICK